MSTIIVQPGQGAHANPDSAARQRQARLASATADQMEAALAFLSMIDPQAFEIAFTAAAPPVGETLDDEDAIPVCRHCRAPVGIFLAHGLEWQHFRGDGTTSGAQEIYDPGHAAEATWLLPDETPEDL